ncbi:response regulator [Nesterenkonia sandarakina]|uniref:Response regulator receiver domain-containing protein n=1 Tax=Nesterenkonia sandarakina TaxID=272918 RepID=A0A2T0YHH6_9MICC|nr:response regulator transcription factor [Nesterenkonia sandarakina]PRZ14533.1 response regulator receiver domain-containing protein [Nesterenkonia sandarakina]
MTLRILLADDQELVRTGLRTLCEREGDSTVIAEAADGHQAVALARAHRPEVVLMDLRLPGMDGITATRRILAEARDAIAPADS